MPLPTAALAITALLVALGCSGASRGEPRSSAPRIREEPLREATHEEPASEPEPPRVELDPATACGRALACCRAFAGFVPHVVESSACAGVYEASDTADPDGRCDLMKEGWRQALANLPDAPADACN
jgi:hypothetical protein